MSALSSKQGAPAIPALSFASNEMPSMHSDTRSERTLKQRQVTPGDVSMPDLDIKSKHMPVELRPTTPFIPMHKIEGIIDPKSVLDGFMLLTATGMGFPNDARQANLSGRKLKAVVEDDLVFFTGLLYLDVSENLLNFESFHQLPKLKELRICCNNIKNIVNPSLDTDSSDNPYGFSLTSSVNGYYPKLAYLDLSYNCLTTDSVRSLYCIQSLIELDLTGTCVVYG